MSEAMSPISETAQNGDLREKLVNDKFSMSYYDYDWSKENFFEDACDEVLGTCEDAEEKENESILDFSCSGDVKSSLV
jgi:hypothetical protein